MAIGDNITTGEYSRAHLSREGIKKNKKFSKCSIYCVYRLKDPISLY